MSRRAEALLALVGVAALVFAAWAAPWLRPSGRITQEAFAALDRPLKAWATGDVFDAADYYSALGAHDLSAVELYHDMYPLHIHHLEEIGSLYSPKANQ